MVTAFISAGPGVWPWVAVYVKYIPLLPGAGQRIYIIQEGAKYMIDMPSFDKMSLISMILLSTLVLYFNHFHFEK